MILFYWEFIFLLKSFPQCQLFYSQDVREGEQSPLDSTLVDMPELQDDRELMKEDRETAGGVDFFFYLSMKSTWPAFTEACGAA